MTVTSSAKLAGVLMVFSLMVSPILITLRFNGKFVLIKAWVIGTASKLVSITPSYKLDLPTDYSVVFINALLAISVFMVPRKALKAENQDHEPR